MKKSKFPPGWDEQRVLDVLSHYEKQTEEEAIAEDEGSIRERLIYCDGGPKGIGAESP